jgi:hypothetical protein
MKILALDIAKNCGFAVIDSESVSMVGSWQLDAGIKTTGKGKLHLDFQHVLQVQALRRHVADICALCSVDLVAVEREFGRGVGSRLLVSLYTAANEAAYDAGAACLGIRLGDWRKHIHGTAGKSTEFYKAQALAICARDGIIVPDADAAEAVLIGRYVLETVRVHAPVTAMGVAA